MLERSKKLIVDACARNCPDRLRLWESLLGRLQPKTVLEVGVWKAHFAAHILAKCGSIQTYYMIDPWRNLPAWNKPFNVDDSAFDAIYKEAMSAVAFAGKKVRVLRGTTLEMADQIENGTVDFVYVDGDHTLRGITIDLLNLWRKVSPGGYLGGDDLSPNIWQHSDAFEPTLVFPFVLYFAESMRTHIYALPHQQFLIQRPESARTIYHFFDLVGGYADPALRNQMIRSNGQIVRKLIPEQAPGVRLPEGSSD